MTSIDFNQFSQSYHGEKNDAIASCLQLNLDINRILIGFYDPFAMHTT